MHRHLRLATFLTQLLDKQFGFGRLRFGLDPLLGFVPGLGDVVALLLSFYLVWIGIQMRLPKEHIAKMIRNVTFDFLLGLIPIAGNIADFVYKANSKNLRILNEYAKRDVLEADILEYAIAS